MSATKRITGDYTIKVRYPNTSTGRLDVLGKVIIDGDLIVTGASTTVETSDTKISDKIMTLSSGDPGVFNAVGEQIQSFLWPNEYGVFAAGLEVERGTLSRPALRWRQDTIDPKTGVWELSHDGVIYAPIITSAGGLELFLDKTPQLGGDLDVNGFKITSANSGDVVLTTDATGQIVVEKPLSLKDQATPLLPTAGVNKLFSKSTHGGGGTGLYYTNTKTSDEIISRNRAIVYSMIF